MPATDTRIARIRTYHLMCPLPEPFATSQMRLLRHDALLVRVETVGGAEGWGECAGFPEMIQTGIQNFLGPVALGHDVLAPDVLWHDLWRAAQPWGRRGHLPAGLSGIDMAVWDLRGKLLGQSVSEMLGGRFRDQIPCHATGLYFRELPEAELIPSLIDEAHEYVEAGFRGIKMQIGRNPTFDAALVRALRSALPAISLHADAGRAFDLPEAIRIGRLLEELNFDSFEEPFSPESPYLYPRLAEHVNIPLSAGEVEQTRWGFQSLLAGGGVSIAQPDISFCGGPSEAVRIRSVAGAMGINIAPFVGGTHFNFAAALHLLASDFHQPSRIEPVPTFLAWEGPPNPLRDVLFSCPVSLEAGIARVPKEPGLGVAIDPNELRFFCVDEREVTA